MFSKLFCLLSFLGLLVCTEALQAQSCANITLGGITNPGPNAFATMDQNSGIRNGPDYGDATIYYPTNGTTPFASVAIVPGFFSFQSSVEDWGPFLASHGIVTIIFDTNSIFDQPPARADALIDALETLRQENTRSASPLLGLIDVNRFAVMGWSMGGGGAQLAASLDPSIKAVVALCPWLASPTSNDLDHTVPVLILSAENDTTAPPNIHADVHYALTPSATDKLLFEVDNAGHSIANDPANVQGEIGKYGLAWLRNYLLDDPCYCPLALTPSSFTSKNITNVICPSIPSCPPQVTQLNNIIPDGIYHAAQTVHSAGIIPTSGNVTLKAGQNILLDFDFMVETGAIFEATIEVCP